MLRIALLLSISLWSLSTWAQGQPTESEQADLTGVTPRNLPRIDGRIEPGEWPAEARRAGFWTQESNELSDQRAEYWLTADSQFLYFAARAYGDPNHLTADEYRQNVNLNGNDTFGLDIDPFGTLQSSNEFLVNPRGATRIRLAGGRAAKTEWAGEFEAKSQILPDGWSCEAKIPWGIMALPSAGKHNLRFNIVWYRSDTQKDYEWRHSGDDPNKTPYWLNVSIPLIKAQRSLKLLPFGYAGIDNSNDRITDFGMDVKTDVAENLHLVGTINPDFRNIENSILSLDHSYFERLASDARPFFQEGANYVNTGIDQRLFASQRISRFDAGVNFYGEPDANTRLGVLSTVDYGNQATFVGSVTHQFAPLKTWSATLVSNQQTGLRNNAFQGTAGLQYGPTDFYFKGQVTDDEITKTGSRVNFGFFKQNNGWTANAEYVQVTPGFNPRIGFSPEQDLRGLNWNFQKTNLYRQGRFLNASVGTQGLVYSHFDASSYRNDLSVFGEATLRNQLSASLELDWSQFENSRDHLYSFETTWPSGNPYRFLSLSLADGSFDGDPYRLVGLQTSYRPMIRMQVSAGAQFVDYRGFQRQTIVSASYDVGHYEAVGGRLVNRGDEWDWYLSYRLSGRRGSEVFLILGDPNALNFQRQLILKVVVPMTIRF